MDIRTEYADTLKEIVKLESQIKKLKVKALQLENQMLAEETAKREPPPHLDIDGCVYWDKIIKSVVNVEA